ncbi:7tm 6 domain containing protein, partial [Asbolus verrucosus]
METYYEWKSTIKINIFVLKLMGLWAKIDDSRRFNLYSLYTVITIIFFLYGSTIPQILYLVFVRTDLDTFTKLMFNMMTKSLLCMKALCLLQNAKIIQRLVESMNCDLFQVKTIKHWKLIRPALLIWRTTYFTFWSLATVTSSMWSIAPILDKSFKEHILPFLALYSYNIKKSPLYEISYVHQVIGLFITATTDTNLDSLIAALMMFIGAQCDILCDNLRNVDYKRFKEQLKVCMKHHKEILSFAAESNHFFNMIALGQFFTTGVSVATGMFRLSMVSPMSNESYCVLTFVTSMVVQVFLYCWFGNEVELK